MKQILLKIPQPLRGIIGLCHATVMIYCLCVWTPETILYMIAVSQINKYWGNFLQFMAGAIICTIGGYIISFSIGFLFGWSHQTCVLGALFASIYVLGLLIEPDHHKPYIWLWKQCKKIFKKSHLTIHSIQ